MGQPTRDSPSALTGATSQLVGPWTNHSPARATPQEISWLKQALSQRANQRVHGADESTGESMDQPGNRSTSQREHYREHLWPSRQVSLLASSKVSRYNEKVTGEPTGIPT
jgi:hypothetical protein